MQDPTYKVRSRVRKAGEIDSMLNEWQIDCDGLASFKLARQLLFGKMIELSDRMQFTRETDLRQVDLWRYEIDVNFGSKCIVVLHLQVYVKAN